MLSWQQVGLATDTYIVTEVTAPSGYSLDTTPQTIKLKSGETSELTFYNEAIGGIQAQIQIIKKSADDNSINGLPAGSLLEGAVFEIYDRGGNIANTYSVPLQSFYFRDTLPSAIRAEKLVMGTYNQTISYKIVYLTNLSNGEYRTLNDNLSTTRNYALDMSNAALCLASNEYITESMFVFGSVPAGFAQVETPYLYARSIMGLPNGSSFVNQADVGGVYNGQWITSVSRWVTKVYNYTHFEMPQTGY